MPNSPRNIWQRPWTIFWVALAVRLAYMVIAHTYHIRSLDDHALFGREMGRVARALAAGRGYSDPFLGQTGPTAWVSPLYPLLLAAIFKVFGVYTTAAAVVAISLNCVFSALTAVTTFAIGRRCFSRRVAVWAAWVWALYPPSMQFAVKLIWETTLSTLLLSCAFLLLLRLQDASSTRDWTVLGLLSGLLALSNPSTLLFLTAAGLWVLVGPRARNFIGAALAVCICVLMLTPWMLRNYRVFHRFIPMRSNAGAEFYLGNGPGATGLVMQYDHPFVDQNAIAEYEKLGEIAYSRRQGAAAWQVVRDRPARFTGLVLRRIYFFWCGVPHESGRRWDKSLADWLRVALYCFTSLAGLLGLALAIHRRVPSAPLFLLAFVLLPLVYCFVFVHARFRHPLEPLIAVLGVWLFQSAGPRKRASAKMKTVGA